MTALPGTPTDAPAPPPGPGVQPPFPAPPTDRDNKGLWIGLGIGGALLVLCCVGGILGFGLLVAGSNRIVESQARAVVQDYLEAQRTSDLPKAYEQLCRDITNQLDLEEFESRMASSRVVEYSVGAVHITDDGILVEATVRRDDNASEAEQYPVVQEGGVLKVCGNV
jgi:hypothetical protein